MGAHQLFDEQCDRGADQRVAGVGDRAEKVLYELRGAVHDQLIFVRWPQPTLPMLLLFRVMQGIGGGGLALSEQAILTDTFPESQRGLAFAMYGVAVVVGRPAVGPALGGWITDTYSRRWIFFINLPVGALSLIMTSFLVQDSAAAQA